MNRAWPNHINIEGVRALRGFHVTTWPPCFKTTPAPPGAFIIPYYDNSSYGFSPRPGFAEGLTVPRV